MTTTRDPAAFLAPGLVILLFAFVGLLASAAGFWAAGHEALYTCLGQEPQPGAVTTRESAVFGYSAVALPIAGVECTWYAEAGGTFTTVVPDLATTGFVWGTLLAAAAGLGLMLAAAYRHDRITQNAAS